MIDRGSNSAESDAEASRCKALARPFSPMQGDS
jgi:hypothetical protein